MKLIATLLCLIFSLQTFSQSKIDQPYDRLRLGKTSSTFSPTIEAAGSNLKLLFDRQNGKILYSTNGSTFNELGSANIPNSFTKKDPDSTVFLKTSATTLSVKAGTGAVIGSTPINFINNTPVETGSLTVGTDYAVYITEDAKILASNNFTAPSGYTTSNSKIIGGFHYGAVSSTETVAGGAFATTGNGMIWTQADVDKIKGINQYSFWDLKFRPKCKDPRGMAYIPEGGFWVDIYYTNTDHEVNGTSKYNSNVASGTILPKKPIELGGNGTTTYANGNWWTFNEIAKSHGKRLLRESEFVIAAFGVTENQSLGGASETIPLTKRQAGYTSKYGIEQASGHIWTWGEDSSFMYDTSTWSWKSSNDGRGQLYTQGTYGLVRVLLGGDRDDSAYSGSRSSNWNNYPWTSYWDIGLRAASDHLKLL